MALQVEYVTQSATVDAVAAAIEASKANTVAAIKAYNTVSATKPFHIPHTTFMDVVQAGLDITCNYVFCISENYFVKES